MRIARRCALPVALVAVFALNAATAAAQPLSTLAATYLVANPPASVVAGATGQFAVTVTNTGDELWSASGPNRVNLAYHWYDGAGAAAVWEGQRTPLGTDVAVGASRALTAIVVAPATAGTYTLRLALVKEGVAWFAPSAPLAVQVPATVLSATYQIATPPQSVAAGGTAQVAVTLGNSGNQTWNTAGANPMNLAYHWYDASGAALIWDGKRTALGADVAPAATLSVTAAVLAPNAPGTYTLRLALVKEGVGWLQPSAPITLNALAGYVAVVTQPTLPVFIVGGTYPMSLTIRNAGAATWTATGQNLVDVSYHWIDAAGNVAVWDGLRNPLPADVAPGASATVNVNVTAPLVAGTHTLVIDLVREGVAWFGQLGSTPFRTVATVAAQRFAANYVPAQQLNAYWAEAKTLPVTLTNTGNVIWRATGPNPVNLAYHIFDGQGTPVVWDGGRTPLGGDVAPGQTRSVTLAFTAPTVSGGYTLAVDLVREGASWFSALGAPAGRVPLIVTSGLGGGYAASTTPGQVTIAAAVQLEVTVQNYGPRRWPAGGPNPVALGYHLYSAGGDTIVWDGAHAALSADVPANAQTTVKVNVSMPATVGDYVIAWDLVQEGVAWFSEVGIAPKREPVTVVQGVVFYGKGFGHGLGLSQYGAQGWATGAAGPALTAEQIVAKYYPSTTFQFGDSARPFNRVLLSQPSSQARYRCGTNRYFDGFFGDVQSAGGFRVLDEMSANTEIGRAGANATWQFVARAGAVEVWNNGGQSPVLVKTVPSAAVVPLDPNMPLNFLPKGIYRGNLRFTNLGGTLRAINAVSYDDYVRGVIPLEMPTSWHAEALKAQAYAARTYAYSSYKGGASDYDVSDDQADQCYGGTSVETAASNTAVVATSGRLITYNNAAIRAYFASSNGGYTLAEGCWGTHVIRSGGTWVCSESQAYLPAVPDPADVRVTSPPNPRASWTVTYNGAQFRAAILRCNGIDIGALQGVDVSNQVPQGSGHVISVRILGSAASVDLRADDFLRTCLGLRSTMVRLAPS